MRYWLMKSEPDVFGIADLKKKKRSAWDGVRNYQARNFMRDDMKIGDLILFYHSSTDPSGVAGIARVVKENHPDPTQFEKKSEYYDPKATAEKPIWMMVEVEFVKEFPSVVTLARLKQDPALAGMRATQQGNRLSITPVTEAEWERVLELALAE